MSDASGHRRVRRFVVTGYLALFLVVTAGAAIIVGNRADLHRAVVTRAAERTLAARFATVRRDMRRFDSGAVHAANPADSSARRRYERRRDRLLADIDTLQQGAQAFPSIGRAASGLGAHIRQLDMVVGGSASASLPAVRQFDDALNAMRAEMDVTDGAMRREFDAADATVLSDVEKSSTVVAILLGATLIVLVVSGELLVSDLRELERADVEQRDLTASLEAALAEVKTLRGILPICAGCKRIRDDAGSWREVEAYVAEHTSAEFSHGMCEACARQLYPEFAG